MKNIVLEITEKWKQLKSCLLSFQNPADVDNIGSVTYYPSGGFHYKYFPYRNQDGYVQPVVMAKLWGVKKGLALMVECKAYAYNIEHERLKKMGTVHFELEIDQN